MSVQENDLEKALRLAATDPASRPAFYTLLLNSNVYALVPPEVRAVLEKYSDPSVEQQISLITWQTQDGASVLPVFTSLRVLKELTEGHEAHVTMPVRHLFVMTRGATLVLNPRSQYSKEFTPDEIEAMIKVKRKH